MKMKDLVFLTLLAGLAVLFSALGVYLLLWSLSVLGIAQVPFTWKSWLAIIILWLSLKVLLVPLWPKETRKESEVDTPNGND